MSIYGVSSYHPANPSTSGGACSGLNPRAGPYLVAEPASNQRGGDEPKATEQGENCTNSVVIKLYIYILIMGALYTLVT
jgi:hypothetical protein